MGFSDIQDIGSDELGEKVRIRGWLYTRKQDGDQVDLTVRDPTDMILCQFFRNSVGEEDFIRAAKSSQNSTIHVTGIVRKDSDTRKGYRLQAKHIDVIDEGEPPLDSKERTSFRQDLHNIWAYPDKYSAVNTVTDRAYHHANQFLTDRDHQFIQFPGRVTANRDGSIFIQDATTRNPHLFLEALLPAIGNTYTVWQDDGHRIAAQQLWQNMDDITDTTEDLIAYIVRHTINDAETSISQLGGDTERLRKQVSDTSRISYSEHQDSTSDHDTLLTVTGADEAIDNVHIRHSDHIHTATIHAPGYGRIARCFELATEPARIIERIKNSGRDPNDFEWLVDLRREGTFQHAGLTLYLDSLVQWLAGLHHEEDARNFPSIQH